MGIATGGLLQCDSGGPAPLQEMAGSHLLSTAPYWSLQAFGSLPFLPIYHLVFLGWGVGVQPVLQSRGWPGPGGVWETLPAQPAPGRHSPLIPAASVHPYTPHSCFSGGQAANWVGGLDPPPPRPTQTGLALTSPSLQHLPLPPSLTPGIGVTSVLGTGALGTRWCLTVISFVSPSRYPLLAMLSSLPHLPWGLAEGRVGTSLPLGTVPRPQDSRGSWPWGAVGVLGRMAVGEGNTSSERPEVKGRQGWEAAGWPGVGTKHSFI